jgi:hypothetical protein
MGNPDGQRKSASMFFGPQNISFNDQDMIYHNNTQLSLKSGGLTKFTLSLCELLREQIDGTNITLSFSSCIFTLQFLHAFSSPFTNIKYTIFPI